MRKFVLALVALVGLSTATAIANYAMTQGSGTNFGSVIVGGIHYVQMFACDLTTPSQCASVSAGGALKVDNSAVTQPISGSVSVSNFPGTQPVSGTVAATESGTWTVQPGNTANTTAWLVTGTGGTFPATQSGNWTSRVVGNSGAVMDFSGQNASSPSAALLMGGQFNTTPTTITNGSSSPFQLDNAGNLLVNIKAGSSAGTVGQGSTTSGQFGNLVQGAVTVSAPNYTATTNPLSLTTTGQLRVQDNLASGSVANGAFASGSISSGAIANSAIASGAFASGAIGSGAVASGAYASGSIGSGAMVDLGSQADAVCGTATGTCSSIALLKYLNSNISGPSPALAATAYNTNAYSNAATSVLNTDLNGNLFVNAQINRWGGIALGAASNYGTSPGAVAVPGVNAFVTNTVNVAGTVTVPTAAGATSTVALPAASYNLGYNGTTWDALQVDASKFLKVNCATGCSGGTFNNNADGVATSSTNGQAASWLYGWNGTSFDRLQVDANKYLKVTSANGTVTTTTMQSAAVANGNGTLLTTTGLSTAILTVNCSACSGGTTVNFEATQDTTNFTSINAIQEGTTTPVATSTAASGITVWNINTAGFTSVRARISGYSAGTVTVTGQATPAPYDNKSVALAAGTAVIGALSANQSVNVAQVGGSNVSTSATGVQKVGVIGNAGAAFDQSTGSAVPSGALYHGVNVAGNLRGWTGVNPSGSVYAGQMDLTSVNGTTILTGTGAQGAGSPRVTVATDSATVAGSASLPSGTNLIGKTGIDQTTPGTTNGVVNLAAAVGGSSTTGNIVANNTTAVVLKASAGTLYGVQLYGIGAAPAYLKIYNATSATCGSGTPVKRLMIPAASTGANGAGSNISFGPQGVNFGTGITYCVTTGIGDADTTAPAASTFLVNLDWQ